MLERHAFRLELAQQRLAAEPPSCRRSYPCSTSPVCRMGISRLSTRPRVVFEASRLLQQRLRPLAQHAEHIAVHRRLLQRGERQDRPVWRSSRARTRPAHWKTRSYSRDSRDPRAVNCTALETSFAGIPASPRTSRAHSTRQPRKLCFRDTRVRANTRSGWRASTSHSPPSLNAADQRRIHRYGRRRTPAAAYRFSWTARPRSPSQQASQIRPTIEIFLQSARLSPKCSARARIAGQLLGRLEQREIAGERNAVVLRRRGLRGSSPARFDSRPRLAPLRRRTQQAAAETRSEIVAPRHPPRSPPEPSM